MHRRVSKDDRTGVVNRLAGIAGSLVRAATIAYGDESRAACRPRAASATWQALVRRLESARPCLARIAFQIRAAAASSSTSNGAPPVSAATVGEAILAAYRARPAPAQFLPGPPGQAL